MGTVNKRRLLNVSLITVLMMVAISPIIDVSVADFPSDLNIGPHVDKVIYKVITNPSQRILALQSGEVEIIARDIDPTPEELYSLQVDPDITIIDTIRNGYGHFTINCRKYPFNITAFRRAFAYAFDKTRVVSEVFDGQAKEHDSVVPYVNGWCIENDLPYNYYSAQVALGNQILDDAGFAIDPHSGYRNRPDGSYFNITIVYPFGYPGTVDPVVDIGVDALRDLGFVASSTTTSFINVMSTVYQNWDYDIAFYAYNFQNYDVDWLADAFWGELANVPYGNPSNFKNATYDSWRDQLLYSTEYEDVYEAAVAMQLILHENVPMVVAYQNLFRQAYRHDLFDGYIEDISRGIEGSWTLRKIRRIDDSLGGTVPIAIVESPDSFNIFMDSNSFSSSLMEELWPTLYLRGPDLIPYPYLAENLITETHSDNPSVPRGHTRFTIDIVRNATWTDGMPITADDVIFSFKYAYESGVHGNPISDRLTDLVAVYTPTAYRAVLEFDSETYWHFSKFAYNYIIPEHIFNDKTGIGYRHWDYWSLLRWNLTYYINTAIPTSGPFTFTDFEIDEFYELTVNPNFCYFPEERNPETTLMLQLEPIIRFSEVGVITVLLVGGSILYRRKSI